MFCTKTTNFGYTFFAEEMETDSVSVIKKGGKLSGVYRAS